MQITKHARQRYVERIKGITDMNERNQYISINEEIIDEHINKMFDYAEEIYYGSLGSYDEDILLALSSKIQETRMSKVESKLKEYEDKLSKKN